MLESRLAFASATAREAGALLKALFHERGSLVVETKGINDFVSRADRDAEALIRAAVAARYPADGFIGEETGSSGSAATVTWVVDPLDGTTNFLKGVPYWCVSIGLLHEGRVAGGVIYDPVRDELFDGLIGGGARLDGRPIAVGRETDTARAIIGTGFTPRTGAVRFGADMQALLSTGLNFRCLGAGALMLAYVAAGRLDAYHERHMWPWDFAAGLALIAAAGGRHTPYPAGADMMEGGPVIAANPALYADLVPLLAGDGDAAGAASAPGSSVTVRSAPAARPTASESDQTQGFGDEPFEADDALLPKR